MTYAKPAFRHPDSKTNEVGCTRRDYEGGLSTLCAGCGHDSISAAIIDACFELSIEPHRVAKLSGIGCSSKTPAYFLSGSHSFNSVHGRMPSVATGANLAHDHHRGVALAPAFAHIGATGLFAHRRQFVVAHDATRLIIRLAPRSFNANPSRFFGLQRLIGAVRFFRMALVGHLQVAHHLSPMNGCGDHSRAMDLTQETERHSAMHSLHNYRMCFG